MSDCKRCEPAALLAALREVRAVIREERRQFRRGVDRGSDRSGRASEGKRMSGWEQDAEYFDEDGHPLSHEEVQGYLAAGYVFVDAGGRARGGRPDSRPR